MSCLKAGADNKLKIIEVRHFKCNYYKYSTQN